MPSSLPSALISDNGGRVQLRIRGRFFELNQEELRDLLGLPPGPHGLGITIDADRFTFEFAGDDRTVTVSAARLQRRLANRSKSAAG